MESWFSYMQANTQFMDLVDEQTKQQSKAPNNGIVSETKERLKLNYAVLKGNSYKRSHP